MHKFLFAFSFVICTAGNLTSAQQIDKAQFSGPTKDKTYTQIWCSLPGEIYENTPFTMMVELRPADFPNGKPTVSRQYHAYFSDSLLYLAHNPSAFDTTQSSGYLNEQTITLFPAFFTHLKTSKPIILTKLNHGFKMIPTHDPRPGTGGANKDEYLPVSSPPKEDDEIEEIDLTDFETDTLNELDDTLPDCRQLLSEASFPGGDAEFARYIMNEIEFSDEMIATGISGTAYFWIYIEEDGTITNITLLRGLHELYDAEAIKALENMPKWIPAINSCDKPVRIRQTIPIKFEVH